MSLSLFTVSTATSLSTWMDHWCHCHSSLSTLSHPCQHGWIIDFAVHCQYCHMTVNMDESPLSLSLFTVSTATSLSMWMDHWCHCHCSLSTLPHPCQHGWIIDFTVHCQYCHMTVNLDESLLSLSLFTVNTAKRLSTWMNLWFHCHCSLSAPSHACQHGLITSVSVHCQHCRTPINMYGSPVSLSLFTVSTATSLTT